jgi:hypothetical protein
MTAFRLRVLLLMPCLLALLVPVLSPVRAQMGQGMGIGPDYYDGSSSVVIHGVIETVEANAYNCRWGATELTLKAGRDTYIVQLGPTTFLAGNDFNIAKGDELRVSGFKFTCQGTAFLIAREVTKGGKTLTLRNAQGVPAWTGRGKGWNSPSGWGDVRGTPCCGCRCRCGWPRG